MKAIDAWTKHLEFVRRNEKLLLWCAQMTKCCGGWTNCCANLNSDVRNAPKRRRKTVKKNNLPLHSSWTVVFNSVKQILKIWWMLDKTHNPMPFNSITTKHTSHYELHDDKHVATYLCHYIPYFSADQH
jgi:hypothetical protein